MENKFRVALKGFLAHKPISQGGNITIMSVGVNINPKTTQYMKVLVFNRDNTRTLMTYGDRGAIVELKGNLNYVTRRGRDGKPRLDITVKTGWATLCQRGGEQYLKAEATGNLAADPRNSHTWNDVSVSNFDILLDLKEKNRKPRTIGATVAAFGKLADACNRYIYRGRQVRVEGDLRVQTWPDRSGNPQVGLAIRAAEVKFLAHSHAYRQAAKNAA